MGQRLTRFTRRGLLAAGVGGVALGGYAGWIEPYWRVTTTRYRPAPVNWPNDYPLRIAAIADPHVNRPFVTPEHMAYVTERVMASEPDLIVLLGDYRSSIVGTEDSLSAKQIAACFQTLRAPLGVVAILGNHDWWDDPDPNVRRGEAPTSIGLELQALGIAVLENQALRIDHGGRHFWLAGLGDQWTIPLGNMGFIGRDDLPATMAAVVDDAPVIMLAHEPDIFPQIPERVALTMCGHTHGGQVVVMGRAKVPSRYGLRYRYGHIVEDGRHLIVNAGIGMSKVPLRFGAPPEIVVVDL